MKLHPCALLAAVVFTGVLVSEDVPEAQQEKQQPEIRIPYSSGDVPAGLFSAIKKQYPDAQIVAFLSSQQRDPIYSAWFFMVDLGVDDQMYLHTGAWDDSPKFLIDGKDSRDALKDFEVLSQGGVGFPGGAMRPSDEWRRGTLGHIFHLRNDSELVISGVLLNKDKRSIEVKGTPARGWSISFHEAER